MRSRVWIIVMALLAASVLPSIPEAVAAPPAGAHITGIEHVNDRWDKVSVFSPSMNMVVVNDVFKAPQSRVRPSSICCPASTAATTSIRAASGRREPRAGSA